MNQPQEHPWMFLAIPDGENQKEFPGVTLIDPRDIKIAYFDGKDSIEIDFKSGGDIKVIGDQAKSVFEYLLRIQNSKT